ncbi:PP143 [Orf virus]|nr:PP143 [Orf virus]
MGVVMCGCLFVWAGWIARRVRGLCAALRRGVSHDKGYVAVIQTCDDDYFTEEEFDNGKQVVALLRDVSRVVAAPAGVTE